MLQDEGDGPGVQPDVQGVQHTAHHGHAVVGLQHRRGVGRHDGDAIPASEAAAFQGRCQALRALEKLGIGKALAAVDHRQLVRVDRRRPLQEGDAEERRRVRRESLRREAEEYHRLAQSARELGDYDQAIRYFERVEDHIRWSGLGVDWGDLPTRNTTALGATRDERDDSLEAERERQVQEAYEQIRADEEMEKQRRLDQAKGLLELAAKKFERGDFEAAVDLADQADAVDPGNRLAQEMREDAIDAKRRGRAADYAEQRKEAYRAWLRQIDELRIPYSAGLTPASPEYWNRALQRTSTSEIGISPDSPEDAVVRDLLKNTRLTDISFEDEEITTVASVLQSFSGITILASPAAQEELDSSGDLITLPTLTNLSVESLLDIIVATLDDEVYAWTVRDGMVLITTAEEAFGETIIRTHPIQDLTFGLTNFKGPEIDRIALPGEYGDDPETSVFASDLEGEIIIEADSIVELIRENVARESWELDADRFSIDVAASNQILVIHTPQVQAEIAQFLDDLRRFSSTVVQIESRFVDITDAFVQEIGADFRGLGGAGIGSDVVLDEVNTNVAGAFDASQGLDNLGSGASSSADPSAGAFFNDNSDGDIRARTENFFANPLGEVLSTVGGGAFQFSILDDTEVNLVMNLVEKSANAKEIMAPVLTVFNTERAYVTVVNQISFLQDFDVDVANTAFIANPEIGILQEGVVLDVRPTISYDRKYVTLEVRTAVAELERPIPTFETSLGGFTDPITFQLPRMRMENANTTVRVPDGGSVILGGLKTIRHVNRKAGTPWLGDIPIVNFFFREKGVADEITSLVIVIRAEIRDLGPYREALPTR